jgi:hypothetical protein
VRPLTVYGGHANLNGVIDYAPRPRGGSMNFTYQVIRFWERPTEKLLAADLDVVPLLPPRCHS